MRQLAQLTKIVETWRGVEKKIAEIAEVTPLAEEDESMATEIEAEIEKTASLLDTLELEAAFSSEYDARNAILALHAGAGGTESQDWAQMLLRMYLHWAERQ